MGPSTSLGVFVCVSVAYLFTLANADNRRDNNKQLLPWLLLQKQQ